MKRLAALVLAICLLIAALPSASAVTVGTPKYGKNYNTDVTLSGDQAKDIVTIAKAQRYKTSADLGFSGQSYGWCDAFVIDCARMANVPTSVIPNTRGCKALYDAILNAGGTKVTTPQAGDIVIYYCTVCKNYPHIGIYAGNGYTCEGNVGGSVSYSDRTKIYYNDTSGHSSKSTIQSYYVRPNYSSAVQHTFSFDANGGTGSLANVTVTHGGNLELKVESCTAITKTGHTLAGWTVKRNSDSKWYVPGSGWLTESEIAAQGVSKKVYTEQSYTINDSWTMSSAYGSTNLSGNQSYTFYAVWEKADYILIAYDNFSGKNYLYGTDFEMIDETFLSSRNTDAVTIAVDAENTHNGYNSLKIVALTAGGSGKDLRIQTMTNDSATRVNGVGDEKTMTLSFWAKSSVEGNTFNIRWGWEGADEYRTVKLTTSWAFYTIDLSKVASDGYALHPYIGKAGTVWIAEMQLEDGSTATEFVPENGGYSQTTNTYGGTYNLPETPVRDGYIFDGWYTANSGGEKITSTTKVLAGNLTVYAHWTKNDVPHTHSYTVEVTEATCTENGYVTYTCACGYSYAEVTAATGHDYVDGVCANCGEKDPNYVAPTDPTEPEHDCPSLEFSDVDVTMWYHDGIDYVLDHALMNGMGKNEFRPEVAMTRAMLVTVLWRYAGSPNEGEITFKDLTQDWYIQAVAWAAENGIVNGYPNGTFRPDEEVTREQLATILYRYSKSVGIDTSLRADLTVFPDANKVSSYAQEAISWAVSVGLITGITHGGNSTAYLEPQTSASRAQVATILMRFIENVVK